jgi:hypothetical protein
MNDQTKDILKELRGIREDLDFIKSHMKDADTILTDDDIKSVRKAEKDLAEGKAKRLV